MQARNVTPRSLNSVNVSQTLNKYSRRNLVRLPSGGIWIVLVSLTVFLLAACGSDSDDGAAVLAASSSGGAARSADAAPDFELALFETENYAKGEVLRLSDLVGKPVVLNNWFPSCPPCVAEIPDLEAAFQAHKGEVEFIGVQNMGLDTAEDGQAFINEMGVTYAIGPDNNPNNDGDIFISYKVTGFPTTLFLNRDQEIVRKWTGLLNAEKLEEFVQELLE
jgi:cytochrome c biogenesis protein CcmG/thiol:disulfide interchange protein DsbE